MHHDSVLFNRIYVICCLPPEDVGGSRRIFEQIQSISSVADFLKPEFIEARSAPELINALRKIEQSVARGNMPLIQIDAHGSKERGIEFRNLERRPPIYFSWKELAAYLGRINWLTQNRLAVISCVCFGYYLNGAIDIKKPAPYSVGISPVSTITLGELEKILPEFYEKVLHENDFASAVEVISHKLQFVSSELFLKSVLIKLARTTIGKSGKRRREQLLSEVISNASGQINMRNARKHIKEGIRITDTQIDALQAPYLCNRPAPFNSTEILSEARNINK